MIGQIDTGYTNAGNTLPENNIGRPDSETRVKDLSFRDSVPGQPMCGFFPKSSDPFFQ